MNIIDQHLEEIKKACDTHNVKRLLAFGSVLTNKFNHNSDVDLIVAFNPIPAEGYADNYFDLKFSIQDILRVPVDLLEEQAIHNPYFLTAIKDKQKLIYGN